MKPTPEMKKMVTLSMLLVSLVILITILIGSFVKGEPEWYGVISSGVIATWSFLALMSSHAEDNPDK